MELIPSSLTGAPPHTPPPPGAYAPSPNAYGRPPSPYGYGAGVSTRSRIVAGVLGILLGPIGVHRFYLGYTGIGILQIVLSIITGGVAGLWGFIEGILILATRDWRDVDGLPLRD